MRRVGYQISGVVTPKPYSLYIPGKSGKSQEEIIYLLVNKAGAKSIIWASPGNACCRMPNEPFVPVHLSPDPDNRITLPKHFSDHVPWAASTDGQAWLLLLECGRYRLLSDEQVQGDPRLESVRLLILEGRPAVVSEPTCAKGLRDEAIVARLVPVTVALHKASQRWRISLPGELEAFEPPDCDPKKLSVLFSLEGYFEIWYTDVLRKATFLPLRNQQL